MRTMLALPSQPRFPFPRVGISKSALSASTPRTSAFTKLLNDKENPAHIPGAKVVAAYKGGGDDIESSYSRVDGYTAELQNTYGVEIVDTIEELCTLVDAVLLSVDG